MLFSRSVSNQPRPQPPKPAPGGRAAYVCSSGVTDTYPIIMSPASWRTVRPVSPLQSLLFCSFIILKKTTTTQNIKFNLAIHPSMVATIHPSFTYLPNVCVRRFVRLAFASVCGRDSELERRSESHHEDGCVWPWRDGRVTKRCDSFPGSLGGGGVNRRCESPSGVHAMKQQHF